MDAPPDIPVPAQRDYRPHADRDLRGLLHDVGHGLATVALLLDTIRADGLPAGSRPFDLLEAETSRLLAAVRDGLRPARAGEPVPVRVLLEQIAELADRTRPTSVVLLPGDDVTALVDPVLLWRVVVNLVGNAMRAAGPDGHVRLSVTPGVVEVVDDGPGFLRGASGDAHLGLDVVTRLLTSCGGRLEIADAHPHGTCARVVLPADRTPFRKESTVPDLVLCDDHPIFVEALGVVLGRHGMTVSAITTTTGEIVATVEQHRPDAVVIDRHFGEDDGIDMIRPVLAACPHTRVLVLTADPDLVTAGRALEAGASGLLGKTGGVASLVAAVIRVVGGETVVDVPLATHTPAHRDAHRLAGYLTPRERQCLALIVDGYGSRAIADQLGVSTATVRTYVQAVLTKLGVHSRLEAASFAVRHSLLDHTA